MYDAAVEGEKRPFPKRILFTAGFDSGKQGKEWPGSFEIAQKEGYFWHAAKSVPHPDDKKQAWIRIDLRGGRPIGDATQLFFRYKLDGAKSMSVGLTSAKSTLALGVDVEKTKNGPWASMTVDFKDFPKLELVREIYFLIPAEATLWIDDLLLYETGKQ